VCLFLPAAYALQFGGCIPDAAFRTVLAENLVRTGTLFVQSFVGLVFGQFFPFL